MAGKHFRLRNKTAQDTCWRISVREYTLTRTKTTKQYVTVKALTPEEALEMVGNGEWGLYKSEILRVTNWEENSD